MASAFDAMFKATALPSMFHFNGESIIYTAVGEDAATIDAVVRRGEFASDEASDDGITIPLATDIDVKTEDCPSLQIGDQFRIDGVDYFLSGVPTRTPHVATVVVRRIKHKEKSDGGVRRQVR